MFLWLHLFLLILFIWVLRIVLKVGSDDAWWMLSGNVLHSFGAQIFNTISKVTFLKRSWYSFNSEKKLKQMCAHFVSRMARGTQDLSKENVKLYGEEDNLDSCLIFPRSASTPEKKKINNTIEEKLWGCHKHLVNSSWSDAQTISIDAFQWSSLNVNWPLLLDRGDVTNSRSNPRPAPPFHDSRTAHHKKKRADCSKACWRSW